MRIGKKGKPTDVDFGELRSGDAFMNDKGYLFMKIDEIQYDGTGFGDAEEYNAVDLESGSCAYFGDGDIVTVANVHIEKD